MEPPSSWILCWVLNPPSHNENYASWLFDFFFLNFGPYHKHVEVPGPGIEPAPPQ